jgi:hypothetical protein
MFVNGPWGDFYLSQTVCGQGKDSPCIDAGNDVETSDFNHKWMTNRTDGLFDAGKPDMGFHYSPHVQFGLGIEPFKWWYKDGDSIDITLDLATAPVQVTVDIYFIMLDPDGSIFSGLSWEKSLQPLVTGFKLPAELCIEGTSLVTFTLPGEKPPVGKSGEYSLYIGALKPGTTDFISNLGLATLKVQ